jgi:hypothetical protein
VPNLNQVHVSQPNQILQVFFDSHQDESSLSSQKYAYIENQQTLTERDLVEIGVGEDSFECEWILT